MKIIFAELKRKDALVNAIMPGARKDMIIAKDIRDKEKLKSMSYFVFDLGDFAPSLVSGQILPFLTFTMIAF